MPEQKTFRNLGVMLDCSRNAVMNVPTVEKWIDLTSDMGYNMLLLYTEDTYEVDNQPYFGHLRGRYTQQELKQIDDYAAQKGMQVVPCIQTLAHLNAIMRWPKYAAMCDCGDILLAGSEEVYQLIDDMFASLAKCLRSRLVNIGMDEAAMVGLGQYLTKNGYHDRFEILVNHLDRVAKIAEKYDFELIMWGDMFFRLASGGAYYVDQAEISEAVKAKIPANVNLIYWDYYTTDKKRYDKQIKAHRSIKENIWFAGGLWSWVGFAPHNSYSMRASAAAIKSCKENQVQDVFFTMWGDDGAECSKFSLLPSLFYVAQYAQGNTSMAQIKAAFREKYGISFDRFMLLDLPHTSNDIKDGVYNPEKYMLYSDCFMGVLDGTVQEGAGAEYAACARKLALMKKDPQWGYLFRTMHALCEALAIKYELGVKTRQAYLQSDKQALAALVKDYKKLSKKIDVFYHAFREQWMAENKPQGFEVQQQRLGGLMCRVNGCADRIQDYLDGKTDRLEELEEPVLDVFGKGEELTKHPTCYNSWKLNCSVSVI